MIKIISEELDRFNKELHLRCGVEDGLLLTAIDTIFIIIAIPVYCIAWVIGLILYLSKLLKER